ncbi:hypothetical protein BDQ17DRAFT_1328032 [Cyathus striatus]|nr:hypothetical protein BDQ17DRAFT_1328032 [Cyathus striatus]
MPENPLLSKNNPDVLVIDCGICIGVGTGGLDNFNKRHCGKDKCVCNAKSLTKANALKREQDPTKVFFAQQPAAVPPTVSTPAPVKGSQHVLSLALVMVEEDVWEKIDGPLNNVLQNPGGHLVCFGERGLIGLWKILSYFVEEQGLEGALFEGKLERLMKIIETLGEETWESIGGSLCIEARVNEALASEMQSVRPHERCVQWIM